MSASADNLLDTLADLVAERVAKRLSAAPQASKPTKVLPDFLSEIDIEKRCGISRRSLQSWRFRNSGPPTVKAGRKVLYPRLAFEQWLSGCKGARRTRRA